MSCCRKRGTRAEAKRNERAQRTSQARQDDTQQQMELEEDPSLLRSGQNSRVAMTPFGLADDDKSTAAWASQVFTLYTQLKSSGHNVAAAQSRTTSRIAKLISLLEQAVKEASNAVLVADACGKSDSTPEDIQRLAVAVSQVDVLSAEAAETADEAQAGADKAHATCADLLSSFNILVDQAKVGAFGGNVQEDHRRPDSSWMMRVSAVVEKMSGNCDTLNMALSKTTSGLKDTSKVLEQAASKASELQPSDPAASDVKAAVEQASTEFQAMQASLKEELKAAELDFADAQRSHEAADAAYLNSIARNPTPFGGVAADVAPVADAASRMCLLHVAHVNNVVADLVAALESVMVAVEAVSDKDADAAAGLHNSIQTLRAKQDAIDVSGTVQGVLEELAEVVETMLRTSDRDDGTEAQAAAGTSLSKLESRHGDLTAALEAVSSLVSKEIAEQRAAAAEILEKAHSKLASPPSGAAHQVAALAVARSRCERAAAIYGDVSGKARDAVSTTLDAWNPLTRAQPRDAAAMAEAAVSAGASSQTRVVELHREPNKGFGLGLHTTEGTNGVRVTAIGPDSPAERSGQLFPNDAILKVNGQNVAQESHEDIINLLRQAGDKVVLEVAPDFRGVMRVVRLKREPGQSLGFTVATTDKDTMVQAVNPGTLADASGQIHAGDYIVRINERVTTDGNHDAVITELKKGDTVTLYLSPEAGAEVPPELENVGSGANADRAVEEGDDFAVAGAVLKAIAHHPPPLEDQREVTLDRRKGPLGLQLKSKDEHSGVFIEGILPDSQAAANDKIRQDDYIHAINGERTVDKSYYDVISAIKESPGEVVLLLSAHSPAAAAAVAEGIQVKNETPAAAAAVPETTEPKVAEEEERYENFVPLEAAVKASSLKVEGDLYHVVLVKPSDQGFGVRLRGSNEPGVQVTGASSNSLADKVGLGALEEVQPFIIAINGRNAEAMTHDEVVALVKDEERLELTLRKPAAPASVEDAAPDGVTQLDSETYRIVLTRPATGGYGLKLGGSDEPGVALLGAVGSVAADAGVGRLEGLDAVFMSVDGEDVSQLTHEELVGLLSDKNHLDIIVQVPVREVVLRPESGKGLGLRLRTFEDELVTRVAEVVPGGAAESSKEVFEGDVIVAVEGEDVQSSSHEDVVAALQRASTGPTCTLRLRRGPPVVPVEGEDSKPSVNGSPHEDKAAATAAGPPREVTLRRRLSQGWGMKLASFNDEGDGAQVLETFEGSPARAAAISPGLVVAAVDGQPTSGLSHEDIIRKMTAAGEEMRLTLEPGLAPPKNISSGVRSSVRHVRLQRMPGRNFGIKLATNADHPGTYITEVHEGGLASESGLIFVGDMLMAINDVDVTEADHEAIVQELTRVSSGVVTLTVGEGSPSMADDAMQGGATPVSAAPSHMAVPNGAAGAPVPQVTEVAPGHETLRFHLRRPQGMTIGLKLISDEDMGPGVWVLEVLPTGAAHATGLLPKDHILAVNGQDVRAAEHDDVIACFSNGTDFIVDVERILPAGHRSVVLVRDPERGFGIHLSTEVGKTGCHISHKVQGLPAASNPSIKVGDHLVSVNGEDVEHASHEAVVALVASLDRLVLVVRDPESAQSAAAPHQYRTVTLDRRSGRKLGMKLRTEEETVGASIQSVAEDGLAHACGVGAGDRLIAINGQNVESALHEQIIELCRNQETLTLVLDPAPHREQRRARVVLERGKAASMGLKLRTEEDATGGFVFEVDQGSPAEVAGLQVGDKLLSVDGDDVTHIAHADIVARLRGRERIELEVERGVADFGNDDDVAPSLRVQRHHPNGVTSAAPQLPVAASYDAPNLRTVTLTQQQPGQRFGFQVGTIETSHGARVLNVAPDGLAAHSGLVCHDDAVLSINGRSMLYATPEEMKETLQASNGQLRLVLADNFPRAVCVPTKLRRPSVDKPWGMSLRAVNDKVGTIVIDLAPGHAAAEAGLEVEDRIIRIEGVDVSETFHDQLMEVFTQHSKKVTLHLEVERPARKEDAAAAASKQAAQELQPTLPAGVKPSTVLRSVTVQRLPNKPLGMSLATGDEGIAVDTLSSDGEVGKTGRVFVGDHLIALNGRDMTQANEGELRSTLEMTSALTLLLDDRAPLLGRNPSPAPGQPERRVFRMRNHGGGSIGLTLHTRHSDNLTSVRGVRPDSLAAEAGLLPDDVILVVNGAHVELKEHDAVIQALKERDDVVLVVGRNHQREVTLNRASAADLGLQLETVSTGGRSYISSVTPGSPAFTSGMLFEGDVLLKINGADVSQKDAATAGSHLEAAKSPVTLVVATGAAAREIEADDEAQASATQSGAHQVPPGAVPPLHGGQQDSSNEAEAARREAEAAAELAAALAEARASQARTAALESKLATTEQRLKEVEAQLARAPGTNADESKKEDKEMAAATATAAEASDEAATAASAAADAAAMAIKAAEVARASALEEREAMEKERDAARGEAEQLRAALAQATARAEEAEKENAVAVSAAPKDDDEKRRMAAELATLHSALAEAEKRVVERAGVTDEAQQMENVTPETTTADAKHQEEMEQLRAALEAAEGRAGLLSTASDETIAAIATARARAIFLEADTDGNGKLSKNELKKAMHADEGLRRELQERFDLTWKEFFEAPDTNSDGVIELEELEAYMLQRLQGVPPTKDVDGNATRVKELEDALAAKEAELAQLRAEEEGNGVEDDELAAAAAVKEEAAAASSSASASPRRRSASPKTKYTPEQSDAVDKAVSKIATEMGLTRADVERVNKNKYRFLNKSRIVSVRMLGKEVVVRQGGNNVNIRKYLKELKSP